MQDQLRPLLEADLPMLRLWRNHDSVRRYMYSQDLIDEATHRAWFSNVSADPGRHVFIYEHLGQPAGFVSFMQHGETGVADWGFYLSPDAPRGVGRQLGRLALDWAFAGLGLHKVCGEVLGSNERSIRFHRTLGFKDEGCLRQQRLIGRSYEDVHCFGMLSTEWNPHRLELEK